MLVVAPCRLLVAVVAAAGMLFGSTAAATDWYVTPNAKGGKGSKEKPFKGIVKALEKAVSGDVIHVAAGEYNGNKKAGFIIIDKPGLTLVGGYKDARFAARDPFAYPTLISEKVKAKGEVMTGGYVRMVLSGTRTDHRKTTIDGFWFDRHSQNHYDKKKNLLVNTQTNLTPMIDFRDPECRLRNSVFLNSAAVAVRIGADASSVINNLFVNVNGAGVLIQGDGPATGEGERERDEINRIVIKNNTFVGLWNCCSLDGGAGAAVVLGSGAEVQVTDNIFYLAAGNEYSMGWAVSSEHNFDGRPWLRFQRNSTSQLRGGILRYFDAEQTAILGVTAPAGLTATPLVEPAQNDATDPLLEIDEGWLATYSAALPPGDTSEQRVDLDQLNQMRERHGLPTDGSDYRAGTGLAAAYPIAQVRSGALWKVGAAAIAARGVQASDPFESDGSAVAADAGTASDNTTASTAGEPSDAGDQASSETDGHRESASEAGDEGEVSQHDQASGNDATDGEQDAASQASDDNPGAAKEESDAGGAGASEVQSADGSAAEGSDNDTDAASAGQAGDHDDYQTVEWTQVWSKGESMVDARIALTAYWTKWDTGFTAGHGKKAKPLLEGASRKSHRVLVLRRVPKAETRAFLKGFVPVGSQALSYVKKKAKKKCPPKGRCKLSFVVRGVIKKAGGKTGKKSPQIIIAIDQISQE